ncbi:type IV toxin-antitoxin system AbiEi family antitoxin domain-containing protein [Virgisporangium ochraceum]
MNDQRLQRVAARHLGLFTRAEATRCGFTGYQIRRRIRSGEWLVVQGKVLAHHGRQLTPTVLAAAARLASRGSVVAGPSAALWYDLPVSGGVRWLWTGPNGRSALRGVRLLRDPLRADDVRRADGIPITGPGRTVFDCLRILPDDAAMRLMDRAVQRGWTTFGELVWRMHDHAGRRGAPRLVRLIRDASGGAHSAAERRAAALLRAARITGWAANAEIRDSTGLIGYGDLVFATERVVVELDGWAFHSDPHSFQRDRTRQNRLVAAGWMVLRFTWTDLHDRPDAVIATIRAALRRAGRS